MISTGSFLTEMDATEKQQTIAEKFARVWEMKNAKAARAGGVSLMALSLAACGSSSTDTAGSGSTGSGTTGSGTASDVDGNFSIMKSLNNEPDEITIESGGATAGPDTVSGTFNNDGATDTGTFNPGDFINLGTDADDTAQIRAGDEMTAVLMPVLSGVDVVSITNTAAVTAHTGLDVWAPDATSIVVNGTNDTILNDVTYGTVTVTMNGSSGTLELDGTGTAASITVAGTTAGDINVSTATTATLTVTAASTIDDIANGDLTTLNIAGSGAFTLGAVTEGLTTISGANNTGGLDLTGVDATVTSVTGSSAADTINTTGAINDAVNDTAINGGDGVDTVSIDTNIVDASGVTNVETIALAADNLTYEMEVDGAATIAIATPGADDAGVNNDTAAISDYDGSAAIVISDENMADDSEADTIDLVVTAADDSLDGDSDSIAVSVVTSQDGGDNAIDYTVRDLDIRDDNNTDTYEALTITTSGTRGVTLSEVDMGEMAADGSLTLNASVDTTITAITHGTITADDDAGFTFTAAGSSGAVNVGLADADFDEDDSFTGGDGTGDTLTIATVGNRTIDPTLAGFETIVLQDAGNAAAVVSLENATGYTTIELDAVDTANSSITNIISGTTIAVTDEADGDTISLNTATAGGSLAFTLDDADAYAGGDVFSLGTNVTSISLAVDEDTVDADEFDVTFSSVSDVNVTITGDDSTDDTFALVLDVAATATSINISSEIDLAYDASGVAFEDDANVSFAGSAGVIALTVAGADLDEEDTVITGGDGSTDSISFDASNLDSDKATISGFETVTISDSNGGTVDMDVFSGETTISVDAETGGLTLQNVKTGTTVEFAASGGQDAVAIDSDDADGDGNALIIELASADGANLDDITVTDFETVTVNSDVDQTALDLTTSDAEVDTVIITGVTADITLAAAADLSGAGTLDISGLDGAFDTTDNGALGATTNVILGADNDNVDLDLSATAGAQTVTFSSNLGNAEVVTIAGFTVGGSVTSDTLDLSALGVTSISDLTLTDNDPDGDDGGGGSDDDVSITSDLFDGTIVLIDVDVADIVVSNFDFA